MITIILTSQLICCQSFGFLVFHLVDVIQSKHNKRHQFEFELYSSVLGMFLSFLRTPPIFLSAGEQTEEEGLKNRKRRSLKTFGTMKCVTIRKQEKNRGISFTAFMIHNVHCTYWRVKITHSYGRMNGRLKESVPKCTRGSQESLKVWSCFFQHSTFTFLFHAFTIQSVYATREAGSQWWVPPALPPICIWRPPPPPTWCTPPLVTSPPPSRSPLSFPPGPGWS